MPLSTWMLELPEIKELKAECYGCDVQLTDFCEFGLKDPENKLPHKRSTALLATFQLRRATRLCSVHGGKAHQWTKGRLSKRYGNVSRLGYSQRWTSTFCRDVVEDWVDTVNPIRSRLSDRGTTDTNRSKSSYHGRCDNKCRSTCGIQRKLKSTFPVSATPKCQRCEAERQGRAGPEYHKPHQREKPDCRLHHQPLQKSTRIMKPKPKRKNKRKMM